MGRSIGAAVAGYVVMVLVVMLGAAVQWFVLGAEGSFQEDSTVASTSWSAIACVAGLLAAIAGGFAASKIDVSPNRLGVKILLGLILGLGLVLALAQMAGKPKPLPKDKKIADLTFVEAGEYASSPTWYNFAIPIIGAIGVVIGSGFLKSSGAVAMTQNES